MFGEIAIIALAIFNQFSIIRAEQNHNVFLWQFVETKNTQTTKLSEEAGWSFYKNNYELWGELEVLPEKIKDDAQLDIKAASALVLDEGTDYALFEKNSKKQMPIASLTKIMTALIVLERGNLDDTVTISPRAMEVFGDKKGLVAGEQIRLEDLLRVMLVDSNNTAAVALAAHIGGNTENFVALMNEKAELLGLVNTKFFNPTGLDDYGEDNYSTAYDLAQLIDYTLEKKDFIWEISRMQSASVYSLDKKQKHYVKNTNELLGKMENLYGGKTGYTIDAGECLALVVETADKKHKIISVVLNAENRFVETQSLVNWVFNVYKW